MYYDVIAYGNTPVDLTAYVSDSYLKKNNLNRGDWIHPNKKKVILKGYRKSAGGSAANMAAGCADLGALVLFYGSVGTDSYGRFYQKELEKAGVVTRLARHKGPSGRCITLITPDKERTFVVSMGQSSTLRTHEISIDALNQAKLFHTTFFLLDSSRKTLLIFLDVLQKKTIKSIDLGSKESIKKHRKEIEELLHRFDVVFANEEEAKELVGKKPKQAAIEISLEFKCVAVVKLGKKGALAAEYKKKGKYILWYVPSFPAKVVDTNGAGDAFAAGFNYIYSQSRVDKIKKERHINFVLRALVSGAQYASKVVSVEGARLK